MENPVRVKNAEQLEGLLTSAGNKVVFILHITKKSQPCRKALSGFESAAGNHEKAGVFGVVDHESFDGESDYVTSVATVPRIESYFNGISCGGFETIDSKEIDRYVISTIRNRGRIIGAQGIHGGPGATSPIPKLPTPIEVQNKILNHTRATNPILYGQLLANRPMLFGMVNQEMERLRAVNQQMMQQQQPAAPTPAWSSSMAAPAIPQTTASSSTQQMIIPTLQQMQYMFEIFKSLQKMGVLDTAYPSPAETDGVDIDKAITLPDGRKIVPLGNDRYGLIDKSD